VDRQELAEGRDPKELGGSGFAWSEAKSVAFGYLVRVLDIKRQ
jgi:hypothetical protein